MKKFILLIPILVTLSCGKTTSRFEASEVFVPSSDSIAIPEVEDIPQELAESEEDEVQNQDLSFDRFSWSIDTLVIDAGSSILNLRRGIAESSLTPDGSVLTVYSPNSAVLYRLDLNRKKLISETKFEKEGPNGVPLSTRFFQDLGTKIFLAGYQTISLYSPEAEKLRDIVVPDGAFGKLNDYQLETLKSSIKINREQTKLFSLPKNREEEKLALAIFDIDSQKGRLVDLPEFGFLTQFDIEFKRGVQFHVSNSAELSSKLEKDRLLIYSQGNSGIYIYQLASGSLSYRSPQHHLVPNTLTPYKTRTFNSPMEIEEAFLFWKRQISYYDLMYDEQRGIYFRLGEILEKSETLDPWPDSEVYLFAYDKDFRLLGEVKLEGLTKVPAFPFFKDGKLWSYVNVEDELGFAVMDLKF